jgi:SAM-dependent methyltransferase
MTGYHAAHFTEHPARATVWRAIARHLSPYVPTNASVLELGAGYCHWINNVTAARRVAVDIWTELPRHAAGGVEPVVLDIAGGLGTFGRASFDVVLASNLLEHFPPDTALQVAASMADVLRPGGRAILIQPNFHHAFRHYFDDYTHRSVFTHVSLPALLRSTGFTIDEVRPRFLPYSMRDTRLSIPAWIVTMYLRSPVKPMAGQMLVVARKT